MTYISCIFSAFVFSVTLIDIVCSSGIFNNLDIVFIMVIPHYTVQYIGICYHLYTRHHDDLLEDYLKPEMLRTRLENVCLDVKVSFVSNFINSRYANSWL